MDHTRAVRNHAATRYLLGQLPEDESAAFEEHFFTCRECAEQVAADEVFAANLRAALSERVAERDPFWVRTAAGIRAMLEDSRITAPLAFAACLLLAVVIYQNAFVTPRLREQAALLENPSAIPAVALKLARSDDRFAIPKGSPVWLAYFMLNKANAFPAYRCEISRVDGGVVAAREFKRPEPGQPVYLFLPSAPFPNGSYRFRVRGAGADTVLAQYEVDLIHK